MISLAFWKRITFHLLLCVVRATTAQATCLQIESVSRLGLDIKLLYPPTYTAVATALTL